MKTDFLNSIIVSAVDQQEINSLVSLAEQKYSTVLGLLNELAMVRNHANSRFMNIVLSYCVANGITDIDEIPQIFDEIRLNPNEGVVVGFTPTKRFSIVGDKITSLLGDGEDDNK